MHRPIALVATLGLLAAPAVARAATPAPLTGHVIVVDPGHGLNPNGGGYTGAVGVNGVSEDANVLDVGRRLAALLRAQGATVYLTRGAYDPGPPPVQGLVDRVRFAEDHRAQIFISIHQNDSPSPRARGVSTYYYHADSRTLAADIERQLVAATGLKNLGTPTAPFYVLRWTTMPAVLVEGGFLSNPTEARLISTGSFHQEEAVALDRAVLQYFTGLASAFPSASAAARAPHASTSSSSSPVSPSSVVRTLTMIATAYGPSLQDNYPYGPVDAFGAPLKAGDIAVDPRVIPLGTRLCIRGCHTPYLPAGGYCGVARDTGGAIRGHRVDLFMNASPGAVASFGIQWVTVQVLGG